jgi:hypothetical protein
VFGEVAELSGQDTRREQGDARPGKLGRPGKGCRSEERNAGLREGDADPEEGKPAERGLVTDGARGGRGTASGPAGRPPTPEAPPPSWRSSRRNETPTRPLILAAAAPGLGARGAAMLFEPVVVSAFRALASFTWHRPGPEDVVRL